MTARKVVTRSLGPSNDDSDAVRVEMRAAELAEQFAETARDDTAAVEIATLDRGDGPEPVSQSFVSPEYARMLIDRDGSDGAPMTRTLSDLSRDERIAMARAKIESCLFNDEQLDPGHESVFDDPTVVVFRLLVEDETHASDVCADLTQDLHQRFPGATATGEEKSDGWLCSIRVPVGSPESCPHGNMPREAGAGHWRDWHRGHGCHLDPDRKPAGAP